MSNAILTPTEITFEALRILVNNLAFSRNVNRQYDDKFAVSGAKIGSTLQIRKPARYTIRSGATLSAQDHVETKEDLVVDQQKGVDVNFTSEELTLHLDDFSNRVLKPAMATLANKIDLDGLALYDEVNNQVGTPGTTPNATSFLLDIGRRMDEEAVPRDQERHVVVNPAANATLVDAHKGLFVPGAKIGEQFVKGMMGNNLLGFNTIGMDQNVAVHTVGDYGGTPLVDGGSQTGSSLVTNGWTNSVTGILLEGDVFTIDDVYAVNPQSKVSTGVLKQFVVRADANSGASTGPSTLSISPAIVTSGATQNVDAGPANDAPINVVGVANTPYPINIGYHKDSITLATADLVMPNGVDFSSRQVHEGFSMRIIRQYDINNDKFPTRIDVLYGWKIIYQELMCRLIG